MNLIGSIYEPDIFAGLRYKIKDGLTVLIFSTGKIVIAGGKSILEINDAYNIIKKMFDKLEVKC